ncbi:SusC/RagA family TonB-linked outer membrane protein [Pedobacter immunditicola]|uniref:SusC/RagA family TonB-linked outer membrane protein n=1 Tax=Pedobacter immunditicola TaxID=3133440 RepID=UPI0030A99973
MIKNLTKIELSFFVFSLLVISGFSFPATLLAQQTKNVIGTVTDGITGKPIPEVTIKLRRTKAIVTTNSTGKYGLRARSTDYLQISHPLYGTRSLVIGAKTTLNVTLRSSENEQNKLVDIGYGSNYKTELTGSYRETVIEDMIKAPVVSIDQAFAGRAAGVQVSSSTGQPGNVANIVIRGVNSITKSASPLYVIDGSPMESTDLGWLNPDEIESINVLKDMGATAIYGSRGANGVIIIRTKRNKIGRPVISLNSSFGFQEATKKFDMMSPFDFVKYQLELNETEAKGRYTPADLDPLDVEYNANGRHLNDYKNRNGTNWQDLIFRNAPIQIHNIAVRGGDSKTKYAISGSISDQQGIIRNSNAIRYQGRASVDQSVSEKMEIGATVNFSKTPLNGHAKGIGEGQDFSTYALFQAMGYRPTSGNPNINLEDFEIDPNYTANGDIRINPLTSTTNAYKSNNESNFYMNAYVDYDVTEKLKFKSTFTFLNVRNRLNQFFNSLTPGGTAIDKGANGSFLYFGSKNLITENTLTYSNVFNNKHRLTLLGGFSYEKGNNEHYGFRSNFIPMEELGIYGLDEGVPVIDGGRSGGLKHAFASLYSRALYSFDSKYIFSATFRADDSSIYNKESISWGFSPSAGLAWNMKAEDFLKDSEALTTSKLRGSYGISGNNRIDALGQNINFANAFVSLDGNAFAAGTISDFYNPNLRWESTRELNIGYDLGLFKDRIQLILDYYKKTTGFANSYTNISSVRNSGLEVSLSTVNVKTDSFKWSTDFNINFNQNKVLDLANGAKSVFLRMNADPGSSPLYVSSVGHAMGMFYGYSFNGIYQVEDFDIPAPGQYILKNSIADNGNPRNVIQPGDIRYRDLNGDQTINEQDMSMIGRSLPLHTGGLSNNFTYKNFDLNIFLQWSYGNDVYNGNRMMFEGNPLNTPDFNQLAAYANRWTIENRSNELYRVGGQGPAGFQSDRVLEDGSYLRVKTVALGYNLPKNLLKNLKISNLRLYVAGQNLLTFTNYTGIDPESSARHSALSPGFDYAVFPQARTMVFGINAAF